MSGAMPYLLDKGPYFEVIEDLLSNRGKRIEILGSLRGGAALATSWASTRAVSSPTGRTPDYRVEHLNEDWFGMTNNAGARDWQKQPNKFPTGFWRGYQGDPEAILRDAMKRTIEVSLGLPPGSRGARAPGIGDRASVADQHLLDLPGTVVPMLGPVAAERYPRRRGQRHAAHHDPRRHRISLDVEDHSTRRPSRPAVHRSRVREPSAARGATRAPGHVGDRTRGLREDGDLLDASE